MVADARCTATQTAVLAAATPLHRHKMQRGADGTAETVAVRRRWVRQRREDAPPSPSSVSAA